MKSLQISRLFAVLSITCVILSGCDRSIDKTLSPPIDSSTVPPTPVNLTAQVGDGFVVLTWSISDTTPIAEYRIYMADSTASQYDLIGDSQTESFTAGNLQNELLYYFRVSAVNNDEFEGYKSEPISAVPELYDVLINNGEKYTNNADVTLSLTAPSDTRFMQISDDSSFSNSPWEIYAFNRGYLLENGDGTKYIYCRYRDSFDQVTWRYYVDSIILDTEAFIDSVSFSPSGPFSPGEVVHFYLYAGETDGFAGITIGENVAEIALSDDGQRGDGTADDGIYEADYIIPGSFDFEDNYVYGNFTDRAGNSAGNALASERISVRRPPDAVTIFSIIASPNMYDRLELNWEPSTAPDFDQYRVYRGTSPGVDSSDFLASSIISIDETSLTDTGLTANTTYYYKVYVVDMTSLWSGSNEVSATTGDDPAPEPVSLYPVIVEPDLYQEYDLEWSQSPEGDFESYRLYRWQEDIGRDDSMLVAFITSRSTTVFTDTPPFNTSADTLNFWYILHVFDVGGNYAPSDSVRVHLIDAAPPTVTGSVAPLDSSLVITWTQSGIPDFNVYRLLRGINSDPNLAIIIFATSDRSTVLYEDESTTGGQTYFYWLDIFDLRGNSSRSNLGSGAW